MSALHFAAYMGELKVMQLLLAATTAGPGDPESIVNARTNLGVSVSSASSVIHAVVTLLRCVLLQWTPLYLCCQEGHKDCVAALLACNADVGAATTEDVSSAKRMSSATLLTLMRRFAGTDGVVCCVQPRTRRCRCFVA